MTKLSPTTVYVKVESKKELPDFGKQVFVFDTKVGMTVDEMPFDEIDNETWLKEQQLYTFNRVELEALLGKTFEAGRAGSVQHSKDVFDYDYPEEYIQSLF